MAESIFTAGFVDYMQVFFVALLIYAIVFAILKNIKIFGDSSKVDSLVALVAAIIVSFSGAVTYAVAYAVNWFVIILFIVFLLMVFLMFLGVKAGDIAKAASGHSKTIMWVFFGLFAIILVKGFFAVNNAYDTNDPLSNPYDVDTSFNTGVDDISADEGEIDLFRRINFDRDIAGAAFFLLIIGIFVVLIGR